MTGFKVTSDLDKLGRWARDLADEIEDSVFEDTLTATAIEFAKRAIERTPKSSGRAAAGWSAILDAHGESVPLTGPGVPKGKSEGSWSKGEDYVEIVNSVSYIVLLEFSRDGGGFTRITVREMPEVAGRAAFDAVDKAVAKVDRRTLS